MENELEQMRLRLAEMAAEVERLSTVITPNWESEAKRAFWTGLKINAGFSNVSILPLWNKYITNRKVEMRNKLDNIPTLGDADRVVGATDFTDYIDGLKK